MVNCLSQKIYMCFYCLDQRIKVLSFCWFICLVSMFFRIYASSETSALLTFWPSCRYWASLILTGQDYSFHLITDSMIEAIGNVKYHIPMLMPIHADSCETNSKSLCMAGLALLFGLALWIKLKVSNWVSNTGPGPGLGPKGPNGPTCFRGMKKKVRSSWLRLRKLSNE